MSFFHNIVTGFREAAKAGKDFNPMLDEVIGKLEALHAEGKLNGPLYEAEQAFEKEHKEYLAKGTHTNAEDSKNEIAAMNHFMDALKKSADTLDPSVKDQAKHLVELKEQMENILGGFTKKE